MKEQNFTFQTVQPPLSFATVYFQNTMEHQQQEQSTSMPYDRLTVRPYKRRTYNQKWARATGWIQAICGFALIVFISINLRLNKVTENGFPDVSFFVDAAVIIYQTYFTVTSLLAWTNFLK